MALDARLSLIHAATVSVDLQYYQFEPDATGRLVAKALVDAARRGVRIRMLLDDWYTTGSSDMLAALDAVPGIEVRLYNPFSAPLRGALGRKVGLLWRFTALNARMHNKLLVADGALALVGGRNIADAYFDRSESQHLIDLDVLLAGAVVPDLARLFDEYWNSGSVWPASALLGADARQREGPQKFLQGLNDLEVRADRLLRDRFGRAALAEELAAGRLSLHWGFAIAFADAPARSLRKDLVLGGSTDEVSSVRELIWRRMARSRTEYVIVTPYLVPGDGGMDQARRNLERGVAISVLTNSLASTDVPWVHGAYRRYRVGMLKAGGRLSELSASATGDWGTAPPRPGVQATLHAKCVVFDRRSIYLGSLNLDPRSTSTNTEIGVFIDDEALAREVLETIGAVLRQGAYELRLDAEGQLRWWPPDRAAPVNEEPEASVLRRLSVGLLSPLLPEELL